MSETIKTLVRYGKMTDDDAKEFIDGHSCLAADRESGFAAWIKRFCSQDEDNTMRIIVVKVV